MLARVWKGYLHFHGRGMAAEDVSEDAAGALVAQLPHALHIRGEVAERRGGGLMALESAFFEEAEEKRGTALLDDDLDVALVALGEVAEILDAVGLLLRRADVHDGDLFPDERREGVGLERWRSLRENLKRHRHQ